MIVCHCNVITAQQIEGAVDSLLEKAPHRLITPCLVYQELGKRGRCCGCYRHAVEVIARHVEARHADRRQAPPPGPAGGEAFAQGTAEAGLTLPDCCLPR